MSYSLNPWVSFCDVAGRMVFLDLAADRYFCLSPAAEQSLQRVRAAAPLTAQDHRILDGMTGSGAILHVGGQAPLLPCPGVAEIEASLLDADQAPLQLGHSARAATALLAAPIRLRLFGLRSAVVQLQAKKNRLRPHLLETERLGHVAAAFARLRTIATTQDQCLPRSLAVARRLTAAGVRAQLVLAVKLQPFAAHAWVQSGALLVNDRSDAVRDFTPILVV